MEGKFSTAAATILVTSAALRMESHQNDRAAEVPALKSVGHGCSR
jgi:hypothetical protein